MNEYRNFFDYLKSGPLEIVEAPLLEICQRNWTNSKDGNLPRFLQYLANFYCEIEQYTTISKDISKEAPSVNFEKIPKLEEALLNFKPWRKGPFQIGNDFIDSEWQCQKKWARLLPAIKFKNKDILDVGSGNGYYCYRAVGEGASSATGIDPSLLSVSQFLALNQLFKVDNAAVLPMTLEDMPTDLPHWDIVMSLGVLYHRKSPFEHLDLLFKKLKPGGELILETLVIEGGIHSVLVPEQRYAMMNNVYFLPSSELLMLWIRKSGFVDVTLINECLTTEEEQRGTKWKPGTSLKDYLHPDNSSLTVEGHPAPLRAIISARKPETELKKPRYHLTAR